MTGKDIFKIWAPTGVKWIDWVRPVPFIAINDPYRVNPTINSTIQNFATGINYDYVIKMQENTAVILDLPGCDSIKEGLELAKLGFRPIPLYNGTNEQQGAMALVDNHSIESALILGALEYQKLTIAKNAPPVFLLDSNRTHRFKMDVSVFDNSWAIYEQDMPSAEYFISNDINKIIVRGETIQKDLTRILYKFQIKGIEVLFTKGYDEPKAVSLKKPPRKYK